MAAEYWCDQGLEIAVEGPEGRFHVKVDKPFARVGHHESSEVVLPDRRAPLRGLYLHATDAGVYCVRLAPSALKNDNGAQGWLCPGQILDVGRYRIAVELANGKAKADGPLPDFEGRDSPPPHPMLTIVHRGETIAHYPLRRRLSMVGRDQHNALQLADSQISTSHCVLYREKDRLWAVDLFSSNGTSIGGQPVEAALLGSGQSLALGDHVKLVYLSTPQNDDSIDDLPLRVTSFMIQLDRQSHRRWRLAATLGLLVLLCAGAAIFFLPEDYLADLWKQALHLWSHES